MTVAMGFPNRIAAATLSGQGWLATLPLWHLTTRQLSQVARSHPVPHAVWYAGFSTATEAGALALAGHNLTAGTGQWRVRAYATDPRPAVDQSTQTATLDLPFDRNLLPPGLACTRASVATYWGSDGLLKTAAVNVARIDHDPATLECLGLLIEAGATNNVVHARNMTGTGWTRTNVTATLTATGLDGAANTATRITSTAVNGSVVASGMGGGRGSLYLRRVSGTGNVQTTGDGAAWTTVALTTAWQRFEINSSGSVGVRLATSGDVIEVDGAQHETGAAAASSLILTAGSTATRSADAITYTVPATSVPTLTAGTLVADYTARTLTTAGSPQTWIAARNTAGTSLVRLQTSITGQTVAESVNGSVVQASITATSAHSAGQSNIAALSYAANDFRVSHRGQVPVVDSAGTVSSDPVAAIDWTAPAGAALLVRRATFLPAASNDAALQTLTAVPSPPAATYDTGWLSAWPAEWLAGTTAEQRSGMRGLAVHVPATPVSALWWRFDARDPSLASVEVGRAFLGGLWRPQYGMIVGATLGYDSRDLVADTDSGAEYTVSRPAPRVARFTLQGMGEDTAMERALEMQRLLGTSGEVLYQWDHVDTVHQPRRALLGRLRTLQPLQTMGARYWAASYELKELL